MKKLLVFFVVFGLLMGCQRSAVVPLEAPLPVVQNYNAQHSMADTLQQIMEAFVKKGLPGVSLAIFTPEEGVWLGAAGVAQIETQRPMTIGHIFHSASVAKTYMATAAFTLVEEGLIDLDQPISTYLDSDLYGSIPNYETATISSLMNHTSGIPDFIADFGHMADYYNNLMAVFDTESYLDYVRGDKPDFATGERVSYSNTNTVLLALVMEAVTGRPHEDLISERIIQKLELQNTYYKNEPGYPAPPGTVNTYIDVFGNGKMRNISTIERNFDKMNIAHDAMLATPYDFMQFNKALFTGELIAESSLETMKTYRPYKISEEGKERFGIKDIGEALGIQCFLSTNGLSRYGHSGGSLGAANELYYYPEKEVSIALCSNFGGYMISPNSKIFYNFVIGLKGRLMGEIERVVLQMDQSTSQ